MSSIFIDSIVCGWDWGLQVKKNKICVCGIRGEKACGARSSALLEGNCSRLR